MTNTEEIIRKANIKFGIFLKGRDLAYFITNIEHGYFAYRLNGEQEYKKFYF